MAVHSCTMLLVLVVASALVERRPASAQRPRLICLVLDMRSLGDLAGSRSL